MDAASIRSSAADAAPGLRIAPRTVKLRAPAAERGDFREDAWKGTVRCNCRGLGKGRDAARLFVTKDSQEDYRQADTGVEGELK